MLQLVARGLTNDEIGSTLFLSPTTAATHLRNIYRKIGVRNRAAASAYALNAGLAAQGGGGFQRA